MMKVATYEAVVENGQIKIAEDVQLPERAKVYVLITETASTNRLEMKSPRLARPEQAADFTKKVVEEPRDAGV